MHRYLSLTARWILPIVSIVMPVVLLFSSIRTFQELDRQREVFLRSRVAALASRLETLPLDSLDQLEEGEPGLAGLRIYAAPGNDAPELRPLFDGQELFRTARLTVDGERIYRAFVPFHSAGGLRVARIDLAEKSADFLLAHARHNVTIASLGGLLLVILALLTFWTERRAARLEQQQRDMEHLAHIGRLAAVLAHEIRNPLGAIKGFAQLLAERATAEQQPTITPIIEESARLEGLVNDLLVYGRPPQPQLRPTSTRAIADIVRSRFLAAGRPARFIDEVADVTIRTDPNLLEQILLNIVRNASEALDGKAGGEIRLECVGRRDSTVTWRVIDNGPGLSPEARKRLFEPFATTKSKGAGLGLAISRKLAAALGGTLDLRNGAEGGVIAELKLPQGT